jgi:hypothetical protein
LQRLLEKCAVLLSHAKFVHNKNTTGGGELPETKEGDNQQSLVFATKENSHRKLAQTTTFPYLLQIVSK